VTDDLPNQPLHRDGGSRPVPDPTELTDRASARLERSLTAYIDGKFEAIVERLKGIDDATKLRLSTVDALHDQILAEIASAVGRLRDVHDAKFQSVDMQFKERDVRAVEQASAATRAVEAALAAQKEAVAKSEAAVGKQLEEQQKTSNTAISDLRRSIDDLKERIGEIAQVVNGSVQQRVGAREDRSGLYATIGIAVTVLLAAIAVVGVIVGTRPA
jgi:hypothetical protein